MTAGDNTLILVETLARFFSPSLADTEEPVFHLLLFMHQPAETFIIILKNKNNYSISFKQTSQLPLYCLNCSNQRYTNRDHQFCTDSTTNEEENVITYVLYSKKLVTEGNEMIHRENIRNNINRITYGYIEVQSHSTVHWTGRFSCLILVVCILCYRCRSLQSCRLYWSQCVEHLREYQGYHSPQLEIEL